MRILVLHAGGLGDLVLVETLLSGLRERYPGARLELLCRADLAAVPGLYASPPDAVHAFSFNPYTWAVPEQALEPSAAFVAALPAGAVDLFVSAELRATWLSEILAAALAPKDALFGDASTTERSVVRITVHRLGLRLRPLIRRLPPLPGEHELDRYARLAGVQRRSPQLRPLRRAATEGERPLVAFPLSSSAFRCWAFASLAATCRMVTSETAHPILLLGSEAERPELERLAAAESAAAAGPISTLAADVAGLADVIANAWTYLGNDTGLAHLAAAYGVPGVTVYGGGTWPAYAPWAPQSAGVVTPIPCFGCGWDCAFDHAYCIEGIRIADVIHAFAEAAAGDAQQGLIFADEAYDSRERTVFGEASRVYRAAQADRAARLRAIIRLRDILERYAQRSRTRQLGTTMALDRLTDRLAATARRLQDRTPTRG